MYFCGSARTCKIQGKLALYYNIAFDIMLSLIEGSKRDIYIIQNFNNVIFFGIASWHKFITLLFINGLLG